MDTKNVRAFTFLGSASYSKDFIMEISCYPCGGTLCYFTIFNDWRLSNNNWCKLQTTTMMGRIISETRQALRRVLSEKVFIRAASEEEWLTIAAEFNGKGNFPYCLGAIEKHVLIQASAGRQSDGGKCSSSNQGQAVDQGTHGGMSLILTILYSIADFLVLEG